MNKYVTINILPNNPNVWWAIAFGVLFFSVPHCEYKMKQSINEKSKYEKAVHPRQYNNTEAK